MLKRFAVIVAVLLTALLLQFLQNKVLVGEQDLQADLKPSAVQPADGSKAFDVVLKDIAGNASDTQERDAGEVRRRLAGGGRDTPIAVTEVRDDQANHRIEIIAPATTDDLAIRQRITGRTYIRSNESKDFWHINRGIDLRGGVEFTCRLKNDDGRIVPANDEVLATLRSRLDERGLTEPVVARLSNGDVQIVIPGGSRADAARTRKVLETTGRLEFREVIATFPTKEFPSRTAGEPDCAWKILGENVYRFNPNVPVGTRQDIIAPESERSDGRQVTYYHLGPVALSGKDIADAGESMQGGELGVSIAFTAIGAGKNHEFTSSTKERGDKGAGTGRIAIVFDGIVKSAPTVREPSSTNCLISGSFTSQEIKDLRGILKAGSLSVKPEILSERVVGATLGLEEVSRAFTTMFWTLATLVVFLGIYYRRLGVVAIGAVLVNGALTFSVLSIFGATLTLPGIAGLILSLAMGIDTNILIYERIREEMREDKGLMAAIEAGYNRAFLTVIDSHLTTISAGLMLYLIGSGPIQGFGLTLMIGIAISLFSGIYVGRLLTDLLCRGRQTLNMMYLFKPVHLAYCHYRKLSYALVALTAVIGIGYFLVGHKLTPGQSFERNFDIEFTGGTMVQVGFTQPQGPQAVEQALEKAWAAVPVDKRPESLLNPREIQRQPYVENLTQGGSDSRQWVFRVRDIKGGQLERQRHELETASTKVLKRIELLGQQQPPDTVGARRLQAAEFEPLKKQIEELGRQIAGRTEEFKHQLGGAFTGMVAAEGDEVMAVTWVDNRLVMRIATVSVPSRTQADAMLAKVAAFGRDAAVKPLPDGGNGLEVAVTFRETPRLPTTSIAADSVDPPTLQVERLLAKAGIAASEAKAVSLAGGEIYETVVNAAATQRLAVAQSYPASQHFSGQVADRMKLQALFALGAALALMMLYIAARFELAFGLGAAVSLLHVVIQTLGIVALFGIRIDLTIIAAFLTIVGYAINDTIVTYDRIRENLGKMAGKPLEHIIDTSIAEVIPRTILTGGHVALALIIMLVFAGESLRGFCATLLIGILLGTYSSVFVASPLLITFRRRMAVPLTPAAPTDGVIEAKPA